MNTALLYLPVTAALGAGLWAMGSRGWLSCVVICLGLAVMTQIANATFVWLTSLVIWSVVAAALIWGTGAPLLACVFAIGSALAYLIAIAGGDPVATVWVSNVFGVLMLFAILGGGILEAIGRSALSDSGAFGRLASIALRERSVASLASP